MKRDIVYYYDKVDFTRHELGEIQSDFNMSFVCDGTKDSAKMIVIGFQATEFKPYTIVKHEATNTWWIVSHDKVTTYMNEDSNYATNFIYKHELELVGAIELLNARDLTDCGFNANRYTIEQVFNRLLQLSTFEFKNNYTFTTGSELGKTIKVDYKKTFENYTLLSAIKEFLEGYNVACRLSFVETTESNITTITSCAFTIVRKTGSSGIHNNFETYFSDARETKTIDKDSYGTTVISNAQNVVSTLTKTYPANGSVRLSADTYQILPSTSFIRLPSKINKVNWVRLYWGQEIRWVVSTSGVNPVGSMKINSEQDVDICVRKIEAFITQYHPESLDKWENEKQTVRDNIAKMCCVTFYSGMTWNGSRIPDIAFDNTTPYPDARPRRFSNGLSGLGNRTDCLFIQEDAFYQSFPFNTNHCMTWKRGGDKIQNFNFFDTIGEHTQQRIAVERIEQTDLGKALPWFSNYQYSGYDIFTGLDVEHDNVYTKPQVYTGAPSSFGINNSSWVVNYIPMSDLKIKLDNESTGKDIQLYNQNGKLTDSNGLSKMLLSHINEIQSDTITRFRNWYYDSTSYFYKEAGDSYKVGNDIYVINNVSYTFSQNEGNGDSIHYFVEGEYSFSRKVATKSAMVNPNTNIRDYAIPQDSNVKRKQVYRDFYEFSSTLDTDADNDWYLPIDKVLNLSNFPKAYNEHTAVIKVSWLDEYQNLYKYYYQLDTTTYLLKKSIYEVVDFNDNNIIGYDSQNTTHPFDISKLWSENQISSINTPISYVDNIGEVQEIDVAYCSASELEQVYQQYLTNIGRGDSATDIIHIIRCYTDAQIYEGQPTIVSHTDTTISAITFSTQPSPTENSKLLPIEITSYVNALGFTGNDVQNLSIEINGIYDSNTIDCTDYTYQIKKEDTHFYLYINVGAWKPFEDNQGHKYVYVNIDSITWNETTYDSQGAKTKADFVVEEPNYKKDALEVPVFEYACQLDDDDILVGDDILAYDPNDICYFYEVSMADPTLNIRPESSSGFSTNDYYLARSSSVIDRVNLENNDYWTNGLFAKFIQVDDNTIEAEIYEDCTIKANGEIEYGHRVDLSLNASGFRINNMTIRRSVIRKGYSYFENASASTIKNVIHQNLLVIPNSCIDKVNNVVRIHINHYKV